MTKSQINKLGERLRSGPVSDADIRMLEEFRSSFDPELNTVLGDLRSKLSTEPAARRTVTQSIIQKLIREKIRLNRIQDIAGCRVIVESIVEQDRALNLLKEHFLTARIVDRRLNPSYGYRAVHLVVEINEKTIEVQIRTRLQHMWAELSEYAAITIDPALKYGGGPVWARDSLIEASSRVAEFESLEASPSETPECVSDDWEVRKGVKEVMEIYLQIVRANLENDGT